jgi:hypothetical protein
MRGTRYCWNSAWSWAPYPNRAAIALAVVVKTAPAVVVKTKIQAKRIRKAALRSMLNVRSDGE